MSEIQGIAATLRSLPAPKLSRKELVAAVRERHPAATKKEIVQAAFMVVIEGGGMDSAQADTLHDFALTERAPH